MQNKLILINGPIASGKTTIGKALSQSLENSVHIDLDDEVEKFHGSLLWNNPDDQLRDWIHTRHQVALMVNGLLVQNRSVIISGPFYTYDELHYFLKYIPEHTALYIYILESSMEERIKRDSLRHHTNSINEIKTQHAQILTLKTTYGYSIQNNTAIDTTVARIITLLAAEHGRLKVHDFYVYTT